MQSIDDCLAAGYDDRRFLVDSDPFWPAIDLKLLRRQLQLEAEVSPTRLEVSARVAASKVAKEFSTWRKELRERGYRTLLDLPGDGSRPSLAQLYWRAVAEATRVQLGADLTVVECAEETLGAWRS